MPSKKNKHIFQTHDVFSRFYFPSYLYWSQRSNFWYLILLTMDLDGLSNWETAPQALHRNFSASETELSGIAFCHLTIGHRSLDLPHWGERPISCTLNLACFKINKLHMFCLEGMIHVWSQVNMMRMIEPSVFVKEWKEVQCYKLNFVYTIHILCDLYPILNQPVKSFPLVSIINSVKNWSCVVILP